MSILWPDICADVRVRVHDSRETIDEYLGILSDEQPITVRQCIQSLGLILQSKPDLSGKISAKLMSVDISRNKETMRKSIPLDILNVLSYLRRIEKTDNIEHYIVDALTGGILDMKAKKQFEAFL